jgi:energy-coupling factor transporter ATP-binding protein EcfA2
MALRSFTFSILKEDGKSVQFTLAPGEAAFVIGANGSGKSALMQSINRQNSGHVNWLLAHRTVWFESNTASITNADRRGYEQSIKSYSLSDYARTRDDYHDPRRRISIMSLINAENERARRIARAVDNGDMRLVDELKAKRSPLETINQIFAIANMPITIFLDENEYLLASRDGGTPYSIAELSDGEKNALLLCADVLTTESNILQLLDEPERHLNRAIVSPLLSALVKERSDCAFIISTHDIELPVDHPNSTVILLRKITFNIPEIRWVVDSITGTDVIPDDVKKEILGSKRKMLFVEGKPTSMDKLLYQLLYPDVTVQAQESCVKVERAVEGIRANENLTWVEAYGLIDADDRTPAQITALEAKGVFALPAYSVEYLYYNPTTIQLVADRYGEMTGRNSDDIYNDAIAAVIAAIVPHRDRLCARLCEKRVGDQITRSRPTHTDILAGGTWTQHIDLTAELANEKATFDRMIVANDVNALLSRYPFRETPVITSIVNAFGLDRKIYEDTVRKMVIDKTAMVAHLHALLGRITGVLTPPTSAVLTTISVPTPIPVSGSVPGTP